MKTPHLLFSALSTPWALMPERMSAYAAFLVAHHFGGAPRAAVEAPAQPADGVQAAAPAKGVARTGGIAIVPVSGPIVEWPGDIDMCEGGTASRMVSRALLEAEADETVGQILMVFSTPGGSVYGTKECGDIINRVKAKKPVVGVAQSLAASAGYWMLSQCSEAYCTPGGEVGSIGVYSAHQCVAEALKMAGVDVKLFSAGKYKVENSPFAPLSDEAAAYQTQRANDYYAMFTQAVAKGRGAPIDTVRTGMGEGRVLGADAALAAGMIDGIATMDEVLQKMQRGARTARQGRAALLSAKAELAGM